MTVTFVAWLAVVARLALSGIRLVHLRRRSVPVVSTSVPEPAPVRHVAGPGAQSQSGWRPRVSSGCGR
ncbi:MAG TPA: hypothetical protein VMT69_05385 [Kineosporiaceae bacterium]|nr:hypothetical protein [Kineosporiaceae bacterium]